MVFRSFLKLKGYTLFLIVVLSIILWLCMWWCICICVFEKELTLQLKLYLCWELEFLGPCMRINRWLMLIYKNELKPPWGRVPTNVVATLYIGYNESHHTKVKCIHLFVTNTFSLKLSWFQNKNYLLYVILILILYLFPYM